MVGFFLNNSGRMLLALLVSHASPAAVSNDMFQTSPSLLTVDHPHHAADDTGATVAHHAAPAAASNNNVIKFYPQHPNRDLIVGGAPLDKDVWQSSRRYFVAMSAPDEETGKANYHCGATLISCRVVLTAAYCFNNNLENFAVPNGATIDINRYSYGNETDVVAISLCPPENVDDCENKDQVAYVVHHKDFQGKKDENFHLNYDFALIIIPNTKAVNEGIVANIRPMKLNADDNVPADGEELETFGWGPDVDTGDYIATVPNTIRCNIFPLDQCNGTDVYHGGITENQLCTTAS